MNCTKKIIFLMLFLVLIAPAQYKWERIFGGGNRDQAFSVMQSGDGGYLVAGFTGSYGYGCYDMYAIKTDEDGDTIWTRTYGTYNNDYCWSIAPAHDRGYLLLGATDSIFQTGPHDVYLVMIDESGDTVWSRVYGDTNSVGYVNDVGHDIQPTLDGGYILVGSTESFGAGSYDVYVIKINAAGDTQWTRTYGSPNPEFGEAICPTQDSGYIVAGRGYLAGAGDQVLLIRIDSQGDTLWTRFYGGSGSEDAHGVLQTQDGGFLFVGSTTSYGAGSNDLYIVKTDSTGNHEWTKTYGNEFPNWGTSVQITNDNNYVIIGGTRISPDPEYCNAWLLKINSQGDTLWTREKGSAYGAANGTDVQQTIDGGYIIAAITWQYGGSDDILLIKTDAEGLTVFEQHGNAGTPKFRMAPLAFPNPFNRYTTVLGHEFENYDVYNAAGIHIGIFSGRQIGSSLPPGVYFLSPQSGCHVPVRVVKIR